MKKVRTLLTLVGVLLVLVMGVAFAAPATAHHSPGAKIGNHQTSENHIEAGTSCLNGVLGGSRVDLWWGESSAYYDKGWRVPAGWLYDAHRNGSRWRNNFVSDGKAVCIGSDSWVITVVQFGPY
jgi:hypothetical protein